MRNLNGAAIQALEKRLQDETLKQGEREAIYRELAQLYNESANLLVEYPGDYQRANKYCRAAIGYMNKIKFPRERDLLDLVEYYSNSYKVYKLVEGWVYAEQECQNAIETLMKLIEAMPEPSATMYGHLGYCLVDLGHFCKMRQKHVAAHDAYQAGIMILESVKDQITDWGQTIPRAIARATADLKHIGPLPLQEVISRFIQTNFIGNQERLMGAKNKLMSLKLH